MCLVRKLVGTSAQIDVFEKSDRVGGRLHVITMEGQIIESGGTIIHSSNKYMMDFVKELSKSANFGCLLKNLAEIRENRSLQALQQFSIAKILLKKLIISSKAIS